jgi:hypothetical protein
MSVDNQTGPSPEHIDLQREAELQERFSEERIGELCNEFLSEGVGMDLREQINGRPFVVAYIPAESKYSDIGRAVETTVFAEAFKMSLAEVDRDYGKYDSASTFAAVIDVSGDVPKAAGALRITEYQEGLGFKDVNDLVDDIESPWLQEIKDHYFEEGEAYDPMVAWKRLGARVGEDIKLEETQDIATHASGKEYRGKHGEMDGVSMLFFHACVRYAMATGAKNLVAIFDLKPLANLQQYGEPFNVYEDLVPHPYGGPGDTIPAFCDIEQALERVFKFDEGAGKVFRDGLGLTDLALFPNEYQPDLYSDQAVGLNPTE